MRGELSGLFEDWRARLEQACALEDMQPPGRSYGPVAGEVRSESAEVEEEDAREAFGLDELWRPSAYCACEFEDLGDGSVRDAANGLVWQKSGAPYPLSLEEAGDYLEKLNQESFAGRSNWRLPTVPEAKLLLTPVRHREELCIQPVFDSRQRRLWTADTGSGATAWFADADLGFIAALDAGCRLHLRAVCDMQEDES
jgi:serine/threonine-protein kinase